MNELAQMHASPVNSSTPKLSRKEISGLIAKLPGWEVHTKKGELRIEKSFAFKDFDHALAFTNQVGQIASAENHHPAILTEWGKVTVTWWTHRIKGLSTNDFILAAKTDALQEK
jgi:4a-hydroxytetrahydrobiopterin dehydratase